MMSYTEVWISIFVIGIGTFLLRWSFIQLAGRYAPPPALARALRFVPAAVLSAIIMPSLLRQGGDTISFAPDNPYLLAAAVAIFVAWRMQSMLLTLASGMATLWLLEWLL